VAINGRACSAIAFGSACLLASALSVAQVQDVALKAAFIYNFALFTTWPTVLPAAATFNVCASRTSPMWESLLKLNGKPVEGRPWTLSDPIEESTGHCSIVVLSGPDSPPAVEPASGTLVIDDGTADAAAAAAITLVKEAQHIRFDIDTGKAASRGLGFSSKLLRLARNVT
jgi:hypothetical protein